MKTDCVRKLLFGLFLSVLLVLPTGCREEEAGKVNVENVGKICGLGSVGLFDRYGGVVVAEDEVRIEKDGELEIGEIKVQTGDEVEEGQVLFTYDSSLLELSLDQLRLDLERQRLTLDTQKSDKEKLEAEKAKAKEDQQLAYSLEIREAEANIQEAEYNIKLKKKEIKKTKQSLKNTAVNAPVSGRIQAVHENEGFDENGNPLPFMTIAADGSYRVMGLVNEANVSLLYEVPSVLIRSRVNDMVWHGSVSEVDTENPQSTGGMYYEDDGVSSSSRYPFYVTLDDAEGLMLGQHVYIEPDQGQENAEEEEKLMLPAYYIMDAESAPYVYALDQQNRIEKRTVTLGELNGDTGCYEVTEGLGADDYIAFPDETVTEGMEGVPFDENAEPGPEEYTGAGENFDMGPAPEENFDMGPVPEE